MPTLVLLIVAALEQRTLGSLLGHIESLGMTALVEVYTEEEAAHAVEAGARLIRVNARDFTLSRSIARLSAGSPPGLPPDALRVAESGVRGPDDLLAYARCGAGAVLVGEGLVTSDEPGAALRDLVAAGHAS
ncbi:MAG: trpC [Pseudonocardia sp.]|nr:trpC [Pseudonocardia sp.]